MAYNGWSNRETWLVNVWFNPESRDDVEFARSIIDEQYDSIPDGVIKDMIDIDAINWGELMEHFEEPEDQEDQD